VITGKKRDKILESNNFRSLKLSKGLLRGLEEMGFSEMTPIQAASIPALQSGFARVPKIFKIFSKLSNRRIDWGPT
jgi:superfamily II DNA/RNA helicase